MITYLSSPKAFEGQVGLNQLNAIRSWQNTVSGAEVILFGSSPGVKEASRKLGVSHVEKIDANEYGTPLFNAMVKYASCHAKYDVQVYVNCDILFTTEIVGAVKRIEPSIFLMTGQRINLEKGADIHIETGTPADFLMEFLKGQFKDGRLKLQSLRSADYFIFRRGTLDEVPAVAVGRWYYENVLIQFCLERHIPVIDATFMLPALHQYHGYGHIRGGREEAEYGAEARRNRSFLKCPYAPSLIDATWQLRKGNLYRLSGRGDWLQSWETNLRLIRRKRILAKYINLLHLFANYLGISRVRETDISEVMYSYNNELKQTHEGQGL